jgi:hypothetical protein
MGHPILKNWPSRLRPPIKKAIPVLKRLMVKIPPIRDVLSVSICPPLRRKIDVTNKTIFIV